MGEIRFCFLHHQLKIFFIYLEKQPAKDAKTVSAFELSNDFCRTISFAFVFLVSFFSHTFLFYLFVSFKSTQRNEEELSNDINTEAKKYKNKKFE